MGARGAYIVGNLELLHMIMFHALWIPSVHWGMSNTWTLDHSWVSSLPPAS